jgi:hypothetical protein
MAVVGGDVHRGHEIHELRDLYVFGDYSTEIGLPVAGHLWVLRRRNKPNQQLDVASSPRGGDLGLAVLANESGSLLGKTSLVLKLTRVERDDRFDAGDAGGRWKTAVLRSLSARVPGSPL